jgi:hypothetical protein
MEWKNPDGSVTRGVVIEDGAGNKVASFGGGGAGGSNASVGANGSAAPTSATEIGFVNALGNLAPVGPANALPVTVANAIPAGANLIGSVNLALGGAAISQGNPVATTESYASLATGQISVTTSATQIVPARAGRKEVTIVNHTTTAVYIGGSGVSVANGLLLAGVQGQGITVTGGAAVYAIAASGSGTVSFLEVY